MVEIGLSLSNALMEGTFYRSGSPLSGSSEHFGEFYTIM